MTTVEPRIPLIPWPTPSLWSEAHTSLAHAIALHRQRLTPAVASARQIKHRLASLFPLMDQLCRATCPGCEQVCCLHACIWADFKDLLFFQLARIPSPETQTLSQRGERCRYGSPDGCRLNRLQRPFICTWYLCPAQTGQLQLKPELMQSTRQTLEEIKQLRNQMEDEFIRGINELI